GVRLDQALVLGLDLELVVFEEDLPLRQRAVRVPERSAALAAPAGYVDRRRGLARSHIGRRRAGGVGPCAGLVAVAGGTARGEERHQARGGDDGQNFS